MCQVDDEGNLLEVDALAGIVRPRQHLDDCGGGGQEEAKEEGQLVDE